MNANGTCLRFYVHENRRLHGLLAYEWLLDEAKKLGIHGGSAFRAIAGFGRHGVLHEDHFFELAGDLPVEVLFIVSASEALTLVERVRAEQVALVYAMSPVEFGVIDGK